MLGKVKERAGKGHQDCWERVTGTLLSNKGDNGKMKMSDSDKVSYGLSEMMSAILILTRSRPSVGHHAIFARWTFTTTRSAQGLQMISN